MKIKRSIVAITGAAGGLGAAMAKRLAKQGARLALIDFNPDMLDELKTSLGLPGDDLLITPCDVSNESQVDKAFETIARHFGGLDLLVNNAGITRDDLLMRMSPDAWDDVIQTNLRSVYLCTRTAMRGMLRLKWGRIISLSSVSGISGNPGQANYAASKAAIIGFSKSVAREIGSRNITVNVVAPGFIETDMTEQLGSDVAEEVVRRVALGRLGKPEEIAAAVGYLASDDAAYVTGQTLVVDGGLAL